MVLYEITLVPLAKDLRAADSGLLSPFYADDATFDGLVQNSAQLLKLLVERGRDQRYIPKPARSLIISDTLGQEEAAKREFAKEGLCLYFVSGSRYLGSYIRKASQTA